MAACRNTLMICRARPRTGGEDVIVAIGRSEDLTPSTKLHENGIATLDVNRLVHEISPANDWAAIGEIRRLFNEIRPDIIHLNCTKVGIIGFLAFKSARLKKCKFLYTAHGWVFNEPMNLLKIFFC